MADFSYYKSIGQSDVESTRSLSVAAVHLSCHPLTLSLLVVILTCGCAVKTAALVYCILCNIRITKANAAVRNVQVSAQQTILHVSYELGKLTIQKENNNQRAATQWVLIGK